jgi:hypothetical protein
MSTTPRCDEFQPPTRKGGIATLPSSTSEEVEGRSHPSCWRLEGRDAGGAELEAQARRPRESKRGRVRDTNPLSASPNRECAKLEFLPLVPSCQAKMSGKRGKPRLGVENCLVADRNDVVFDERANVVLGE